MVHYSNMLGWTHLSTYPITSYAITTPIWGPRSIVELKF